MRHVNGKKVLYLRSPALFSELLAEAKVNVLEKEMKDEHNRTSRAGRSTLSSRAIALMRKSKLWVKTDKRLVVNGAVQILDK
eukprot:2361776-Karenia_brevis.AAC.1